jgi:hypothetical protein
VKPAITKRFGWIALVSVAVLVGTYAALSWDACAPDAEHAGPGSKIKPSTLQRDIAALRDDVATLERQLSSLTGQIEAARARAPNEPPVDGAEPDTDNAAPNGQTAEPQTQAQAKAQYRQHMHEVDAAFLDEPRDPSWSANTSELIQRAFADDGVPGGLVRNVECRSRTCRVELEDDGSGQLGKSLPLFAQQVGQVLPNISADHVDEPDGRTITVLYMSQPNER